LNDTRWVAHNFLHKLKFTKSLIHKAYRITFPRRRPLR
jgi:hypothetical protein